MGRRLAGALLLQLLGISRTPVPKRSDPSSAAGKPHRQLQPLRARSQQSHQCHRQLAHRSHSTIQAAGSANESARYTTSSPARRRSTRSASDTGESADDRVERVKRPATPSIATGLDPLPNLPSQILPRGNPNQEPHAPPPQHAYVPFTSTLRSGRSHASVPHAPPEIANSCAWLAGPKWGQDALGF